jgi:hypothetical protein
MNPSVEARTMGDADVRGGECARECTRAGDEARTGDTSRGGDTFRAGERPARRESRVEEARARAGRPGDRPRTEAAEWSPCWPPS